MKSVQNLIEGIRDAIQSLDGVARTSSYYNNQEAAYAQISFSFEPGARAIRELKNYIFKTSPNTIREDFEALKREQDLEHWMIELTYGRGTKKERDEKIARQANDLLNSIEKYLKWKILRTSHIRKTGGKSGRNSRTKSTS